MSIFFLAWKSLLNRRSTAALTLLSLAISVSLLLGVEKIRTETKRTFNSTISGSDLIVGARTGPVQLLLYSVFHIGDATNNISWESYQTLRQSPLINWSIPLSLGDSHKGYRVLGTDDNYLKHYRYGRKQSLSVLQGSWFNDLHDAVLGSEVARQLGYQTGDSLVLAHGTGRVSFVNHNDHPFHVSGVLAPTGTPVDQSIHVSLHAIEAIHSMPGAQHFDQGPTNSRITDTHEAHLQPASITAALIGLKSRVTILQVQRTINEYPHEPLLAIIPGVTLRQLWSLMGSMEKALLAISAFVVIAGLVGMLTTLLTSINERRREMAILRSLGARPWHIFTLILSESALLSSMGCALGLALLYLLMLFAQPLLNQMYGIQIEISPPGSFEFSLIAMVISGALMLGIIPAWRAYRNSLSDGLTIRT